MMTDQEHSEKKHKDSVELKWVYVLSVLGSLFSLLGAIFLWGYNNLDERKLDKAVFEQQAQRMTDMRDDIRAIREIMDRHAFRQFGGH